MEATSSWGRRKGPRLTQTRDVPSWLRHTFPVSLGPPRARPWSVEVRLAVSPAGTVPPEPQARVHTATILRARPAGSQPAPRDPGRAGQLGHTRWQRLNRSAPPGPAGRRFQQTGPVVLGCQLCSAPVSFPICTEGRGQAMSAFVSAQDLCRKGTLANPGHPGSRAAQTPRKDSTRSCRHH